MRLIERDDSVLVVIDAQRGFADRAGDGAGAGAAVVDRIAWLAGVATALGVPTVVTEEDPARNGPTAAAILGRLLVGTPPPFVKPVFGLADVPEILAALEATGRRTTVLTGFETDVCVAHSALGLLDHGFLVAVVADATGSPGAMHEHGIRRMSDAAVTVVHAKGVYYEWVRTLAAAVGFEAEHPDLAGPPGFSL
jgi:nicotinamidase-related amidase